MKHYLNEGTPMKTLTKTMILALLITLAGCAKQDDSEQGRDKDQSRQRGDLHVAALQGNLSAIQQHIKANSDLNEKDAYGSSALTVAITFGKTQVAEALIHAGADLSITNNEGATPLHIAAFFCRAETVQALLDSGADKAARNKAGRTALDSVAGPFETAKGIYDSIGKGLKPLGLKLDYDRIRTTRPRIAAMLR
ncbi:MAG: ankyrin repeat domain-containing protein [Phycisphaeraceae bacterium]|nr:ankyrin repeat domain-containing protein [Phycisphaeraceae bacterium]